MDPNLSTSANNWGISTGPWLWSVTLRILFVLDGEINLSKSASAFGLGHVVETLRDGSYAWWSKFHVDVAYRDGSTKTVTVRDHRHDPVLIWTRFHGFRFTQPGFSLTDYDQVWFFGHWPGGAGTGDSEIYNERYSPLEPRELKILAEWMDNGGSVFATGDHSTLGAPMCSRIPRVRTMRKWKHSQGVPPMEDFGRNETRVHVPHGVSSEEQEADIWPQRIYPVHQRTAVTARPSFNRDLQQEFVTRPHPLLCTPSRPILWFPDHMHEGEVIEDESVALDQPLEIPEYNRPEYPAALQGTSDPASSPRPTPQVIAYGLTTNFYEYPRRFGLIGVYDGDSAGIGRVVVDSTWHHWLSYNLVGFEQRQKSVYEGLQAYYRNVGLWLAKPAQRTMMLTAATWGAITGSSSMVFYRAMGEWELGMKATDVIGRTVSSCVLHDLTRASLGSTDIDLLSNADDLAPGEPSWSFITTDVLDRAIVGSLGKSLLELAIDYKEDRARGQRTYLDGEAMGRLAARGIEQGFRLVIESSRKRDNDMRALRNRLEAGLPSLADASIRVPVGVMRLRIVIEKLQIPDPTDAALIEEELALTVRALVNETVIAEEKYDRLEVVADSRGMVAALERALIEASVQNGEFLTIEASPRDWDFEDPGPVRFRVSHRGDPSTWVGEHSPDNNQPWRIWYRVEAADTTPLRR